MRLDYDNARTRAGGIIEGADRAEQKRLLTLFGEFYESQNGTPMSEEQQAFADKLIASIWEEEDETAETYTVPMACMPDTPRSIWKSWARRVCT